MIGRGETCASVIGRELLWVGCDINKYLLIIVSWRLIISGAFQVFSHLLNRLSVSMFFPVLKGSPGSAPKFEDEGGEFHLEIFTG